MNKLYYSYQRVHSFNAMMNYIIGERGVGKTYGAIEYVVDRFLKKGSQFVYLRRYKTELKSSVPQFFDAIKENPKYQDIDLYVKNNKFYINKTIAGYPIALSTANILKSTSFNNVDTIIFDEFIIDRGCYHYLPNEVEKMLDIVETIGRMRDIKIFFLANAISITNPYFTYFDLSLPYKNDIKTFKNGLILVNYIKNTDYRAKKKQTKFGQLIEGTDYSKYAIDNEFLRDSTTFIKKKHSNCQFYYILKLNHQNYGIWVDYKNEKIYVSYDYDKTCPIQFTITQEDHEEHTILLRIKASPFLKALIEYYRNGNLYFESVKIKNNMMTFINKNLSY